MPYIGIVDLKVRAIIGINPIERIIPQKVLINLRFKTNTDKSAATDDINDTINYRTLTKHIIGEVKKTKYNLLESLSRHIVEILQEYPAIQSARLRVEKPGALRYSKTVYLETNYHRNTS